MSRTPHAFLAMAFVAGLIIATPAQAQIQCAPRERIVDNLEKKFGETRRGAGLSGKTRVFELFTNDETGSWTVLMTRPDGITCISRSGEHWQDIKPEPPGDPT